MALRDKYANLIRTAESAGLQGLNIREKENVLYIDAEAPSESVKKQLWDTYNQIDPNYRSADVVMNIKVNSSAARGTEYEVRPGDNLSKIGKKYNLRWQEIYEANKDTIKDPDLIQPGWKLKIPVKQ